MLFRVVFLLVNAEDDGDVLATGRRRNDDLFAPPLKCALAFSASVKRPVDSMTISAPKSRQGILAGSRSAMTFSF